MPGLSVPILVGAGRAVEVMSCGDIATSLFCSNLSGLTKGNGGRSNIIVLQSAWKLRVIPMEVGREKSKFLEKMEWVTYRNVW